MMIEWLNATPQFLQMPHVFSDSPGMYFLAILVDFSLGKGMFSGNFGQSTVEIQ